MASALGAIAAASPAEVERHLCFRVEPKGKQPYGLRLRLSNAGELLSSIPDSQKNLPFLECLHQKGALKELSVVLSLFWEHLPNTLSSPDRGGAP